MRFPIILILIVILGYALAGVAGLIVAVVLLAFGYLLSVRLNPRIRHDPCGGTGRAPGLIYSWTYHRCQACGGTGRLIRYGAARWGPQSIRDEADRLERAREQARQTRAWR